MKNGFGYNHLISILKSDTNTDIHTDVLPNMYTDNSDFLTSISIPKKQQAQICSLYQFIHAKTKQYGIFVTHASSLSGKKARKSTSNQTRNRNVKERENEKRN